MRTRASMGKMVNKLTKREKAEAFALIDRITRGANQPYTREFIAPKVVTSNMNVQAEVKRQSTFFIQEQTQESMVISRNPAAEVVRLNEHRQSENKVVNLDMHFPKAFYEYFEIVNQLPSKVG